MGSSDIYLAARKGLVEYRSIFLRTEDDVDSPDFHYEWSRELLRGDGHVAFEGFRESLPLDTLIPTTKGFKKMRDMVVGDNVYGRNGAVVRVDYVSPVFDKLACYRIDFDDGTSQVCSGEHLWYVNDKKKRKVRNVSTEEMFSDYYGWEHKNGYREYRFRVPMCNAVQYWKRGLKVDPYVLGFWLGDGTSADGSFTIGKRDYDEIEKEFSVRGYELRARKDDGRGTHFSVLGLKKYLRNYGLINNKHIPEQFLLSSVKDRVDLLKGLIDSDGDVSKECSGTKKGTVSFSSINRVLADDVLQLVRSLGWKATITKKESWFNGKKYSDCYRVCFKPDRCVSALSFKNNCFSVKNERSRWKTIKNIQRVDSVPTQCIGVDSKEGTYLINKDYTVTHNSGKGSLIMRAFPLYALTFPNERWNYIVLLKSNMVQARKALKNITTEFMNNPMISARRVKVVKNTSDVFEVVLDYKGRDFPVLIEAYGKGASIRGLNNKDVRPSIILGDDIQDSSDMLSEVIPDNDWEWFLGDVMFLGKSARVFLIGNNLGERCIIEKVARNAGALNFKFKRIPCANEDLTVSTWPAKQSIEDIRKERENYIETGKLDVWLREKMCMSVNEEIKMFKDEYYRHYPLVLKDRIANEGEILAALDPASSSRRDSCFRAIVVGALMPDGHWYLLDCPYGRWDSIEMIDQIFNVVRKWGIRDFGIEKGQYQQILEPILYREMTLRRCRFTISMMEHGKIGNKFQRIKMLQPYFKSGSIWFPEGDEWLSEMKSELGGVTRDDIKSEFIDLVDALAMLVTQMRSYSSRREEDRGKYELGNKNVIYEFNPSTC